MSGHTKNQHALSQFMQRFFQSKDDKHIWCYDLRWKKAEERSIENVASDDYFYDKVLGEKEGSLEYMLRNVETATAPIIKKILETGTLNLSSEELADLCIFMALQINRSKAALKQIEKSNAELMGPILDLAKFHNTKLDFEVQSPRDIWLSMMRDSTPEFAVILSKKLWFLVQSDKMFYTSDNPVVRNNTINRKEHRGTLGLNSDGIEIYFPLSDSLAICLFCERTYSQLAGEKLILKPENIEYMNALQVVYADRFVLSSTNNFKLILDMIEKNEVKLSC